MFKKYLLQNLILTLTLGVLGYSLYATSLASYYNNFIPILVILSLGLNLLGYYLAQKNQKASNQIMLVLVQSFGLRFFTYIALVVVFIYRIESTEMRVSFIAALFVVYVLYTFLEVRGVLKLLQQPAGNKSA